ncbi:uncharacterized protein TM35_000163030 [Trypanosoma theileri]|uniref:RNA-editing substrate-binding complex 6 protein domain-containing protein n=1 Tax=Trypanosoma theileri TaxID=67003 RepID=A0A1X0NVE5_9TRYP|nr:uncharacterized protein TM35_000163030 [Trypanosoma theileri]ORC88665.1 hypothetical protein TM35_000163030 [Trypanosoma theileri]
MSRKLIALLGRIASPFLAVRLTKEELCLSMAALSRLPPLRQDELVGINFDAIAKRAQRVSPLCTPTEIGMISDGATALLCGRVDLADALISDLYTAIKKEVPCRINQLTATVRYTNILENYYNETVPVLLRSAAKLLHKNDSLNVLDIFVRLAKSYLPEEEFNATMDELRMKATDEQVNWINTACNRWKDKIVSKMDGRGNTKEEQGKEEGEEEEENGWTASRARKWLSLRVRNNKLWTLSEAVQALELYAYFAVRDPVLLEKIQDAAISVIPKASKSEINEIRKVVMTSFHLFPRVRKELTDCNPNLSETSEKNNMMGSNSSIISSLAKRFKTSQAYENLLMGRKIPEDWLFEVMQEQDGTSPVDVAAQAACIFAEKGEIPEGIILQISAHVEDLSLSGFAAFIRAVRRDSSEALLPQSPAVFRKFAMKGIREATLETLKEICMAYALPFPRGTSKKEDSLYLKDQHTLEEAVITQLLSIMRDTSSISFICEIAKVVHSIDKMNEVVQFVCQSVYTQKEITVDDALALLDMLFYRNYVHEPLLDMMEPIFRRLVESVILQLENGSEINEVEAQQVAKFAALQASFDAPDFEVLATQLIHAVEENMERTPKEYLPGVGLLCQRYRRDATVQKIQDKLMDSVQNLSDKALESLIRLSTKEKNTVVKELVNQICSVVSGRLAYQRVLPPDVVALTVVLHCRHCSSKDIIEETLTDYVLEWMEALSSEVYVSLSRVVHLGGVSESFANGIMDDFPRRLNFMTPTEIALVAFGLGEVTGVGQRLSHQLIAEKCSDYVVDHSHEFWSGKDISYLIYGFSRMQCTKRSLYNVFATRLAMRPILSSMDQESISLAVGAFGRSKYLDKKLFDSFSRRILEQSNNLQAADLMLTIRGFSRVMLLNDTLYENLGTKAAEKVNEFPIDSQCTLLASFGSLGIEHEKLATRMLDGIVSKIEELEDANKATDVIASLWQMNYDVESDKHVGQLTDWIIDKSEELNANSIGKLCCILSDTNWRHVPLIRAIAEQSVRLQTQENVSPECCRAVLDTLGTFMIHHQGARENLSMLGRSVSKERIQLSEEEEQQVQLLLRR